MLGSQRVVSSSALIFLLFLGPDGFAQAAKPVVPAAAASAAAVAPEPAPLTRPAFSEEEKIAEYLRLAGLEDRLKLYDAYFRTLAMTGTLNRLIALYFEPDIGVTTPFKRAALADLAIKTAKTPGLSTDALNGFWLILQTLSLYPDVAGKYYLGLPILNRDSGLNDISLSGLRATVLTPLLPTLLTKMNITVRETIYAESLRWLTVVVDETERQEMRKITRRLTTELRSFFAALEATEYYYSDQIATKLAAADPTDADLEAWLPVFLQSSRSLKGDAKATAIELRDAAKLRDNADLIKIVTAASGSTKVRVASLARYLLTLIAPTPELTASWLPMSAVSTIANEWNAFFTYRIAAARGEKLSDSAFVACLDPKRPSLAAAVLEDRFFDKFDNPDDYNLPPGEKRTLTSFETTVLRKSLALAQTDSVASLLPVLQTIACLGRLDYLSSISPFIRSPLFAARNFALRTLLRYANTAHYGLLVERLDDSSIEIRRLAIAGLGKIRDSRAVDALARIINDPMEYLVVRIDAAKALGTIGDRRMIQIFTDILRLPAVAENADTNLRLYAAYFLGEQREKTTVAALLRNIDPTSENLLNYYCIEALGKIDDPEGLRQLVPILGQAALVWRAENGENDNLYAALWALFPQEIPETENLCAENFAALRASYSDAAFISAYYLSRNAAEKYPAAVEYADRYYAAFFMTGYRVFQFAKRLEGRWDQDGVGYIAKGLSRYDSTTQQWTIKAMCEQPAPAFILYIDALRGSADADVRHWLSKLAARIAEPMKTPSAADASSASALLAIIEAWRKLETDGRTLEYLNRTAGFLSSSADAD